MKDDYKEFIRFCITGFAVIGTDVALYSLLVNVCHPALAKSISFSCGAVVSYITNKFWTFKQKQPTRSEILRFILANASGLVINVFINSLVLKMIPSSIYPALVAATVLTSIYIYLVFKFWVFTDELKQG